MSVETDEAPAVARAVAALPIALTFDDVSLKPRHSAVLPNEVAVATRLTRNIALNVPLASAAMDTVTESRMAIAMAQLGGSGSSTRTSTSPIRRPRSTG